MRVLGEGSTCMPAAQGERLGDHPSPCDYVGEIVTTPTTMPWGNRALLFRYPDGSLVNLFTPITDEARAKFWG